jgi:peptidoglycan/xylan/chitin deacetylase (PgdA/CDA1 family)
MYSSTLIVLLLTSLFSPQPRDNVVWHHRKCAVVLTYDDALNVHLDNVVPLLDSLGFRATFYVPGFFPGFRERVKDWISVAKEGHELGNHTLFHPCEGKSPGREWVKPDYDLNKYTVQRMVDEIGMANTLLEAMDGRTRRTFAYPCGDMKAGDSSYVDWIKGSFVAARGVGGEMQRMNEIDLYDIHCYMVSGQSGDELIGLVKKAMENNALLVFLFHGVGGEHNLNVSLDAHRKLLDFLKQNEMDVWIAPLVEVAEYVRQNGQRRN